MRGNHQRARAGQRLLRCQAFSLPEAVVASFIVGLLFMANMYAISLCRIQLEKDKNQAVVLDFATHYLELVKGMPFEEVKPGAPVNRLFDGRDGGPTIVLPATDAWLDLATEDILTFHPELAWLVEEHLQMRVAITVDRVAGADHTKTIELDLRWDSPIGRGGTTTLRMDLVRVKDA